MTITQIQEVESHEVRASVRHNLGPNWRAYGFSNVELFFLARFHTDEQHLGRLLTLRSGETFFTSEIAVRNAADAGPSCLTERWPTGVLRDGKPTGYGWTVELDAPMRPGLGPSHERGTIFRLSPHDRGDQAAFAQVRVMLLDHLRAIVVAMAGNASHQVIDSLVRLAQAPIGRQPNPGISFQHVAGRLTEEVGLIETRLIGEDVPVASS